MNKDNLTNHIIHSFPEQALPDFKILEVPQEINLWILSILEDSTTTEELPSKYVKEKDQTSENGLDSALNPESKTIFCRSITPKKESKSSVPSQQQSEETFWQN